MASSAILHSLCSSSLYSSQRHKSQTLTPPSSHFLSPGSALWLKKRSFFPNLQLKNATTSTSRSILVVFAEQSNFVKVIQTVWKVGRDGIEAGTNLVPDSIPRSIARISVMVVVSAISLFVPKSFLSTAFFVLRLITLQVLHLSCQ